MLKQLSRIIALILIPGLVVEPAVAAGGWGLSRPSLSSPAVAFFSREALSARYTEMPHSELNRLVTYRQFGATAALAAGVGLSAAAVHAGLHESAWQAILTLTQGPAPFTLGALMGSVGILMALLQPPSFRGVVLKDVVFQLRNEKATNEQVKWVLDVTELVSRGHTLENALSLANVPTDERSWVLNKLAPKTPGRSIVARRLAPYLARAGLPSMKNPPAYGTSRTSELLTREEAGDLRAELIASGHSDLAIAEESQIATSSGKMKRISTRTVWLIRWSFVGTRRSMAKTLRAAIRRLIQKRVPRKTPISSSELVTLIGAIERILQWDWSLEGIGRLAELPRSALHEVYSKWNSINRDAADKIEQALDVLESISTPFKRKLTFSLEDLEAVEQRLRRLPNIPKMVVPAVLIHPLSQIYTAALKIHSEQEIQNASGLGAHALAGLDRQSSALATALKLVKGLKKLKRPAVRKVKPKVKPTPPPVVVEPVKVVAEPVKKKPLKVIRAKPGMVLTHGEEEQILRWMKDVAPTQQEATTTIMDFLTARDHTPELTFPEFVQTQSETTPAETQKDPQVLRGPVPPLTWPLIQRITYRLNRAGIWTEQIQILLDVLRQISAGNTLEESFTILKIVPAQRVWVWDQFTKIQPREVDVSFLLRPFMDAQGQPASENHLLPIEALTPLQAELQRLYAAGVSDTAIAHRTRTAVKGKGIQELSPNTVKRIRTGVNKSTDRIADVLWEAMNSFDTTERTNRATPGFVVSSWGLGFIGTVIGTQGLLSLWEPPASATLHAGFTLGWGVSSLILAASLMLWRLVHTSRPSTATSFLRAA